MADTILVVDDKDRVAARLKQALGESRFAVSAVSDVRSAKQQLIQSEVALVVMDVALGADASAGITLCRQLREHERFSSIPVILLSESLGEELVKAASECGAQGLVGWPFPMEPTKQRLYTLLGIVETAQKPVAAKPQSSPPAQPVVPTNGEVPPALQVSVEDKLRKAQHLLALVLHNLKTSNLLELVELEDVPGIVLQMTRNVCGDGGNAADKSPAKPSKPQPAPAKATNTPEVSLDLDSVFGIKK